METIGETLLAARTEKGVSLSQAASATRIKIQHIESMEQDDFSQIAADMYARGFIKLYAEYLGLNPEPLLRLYQQEHAKAVTPSLVEEPPEGEEEAAAENDTRDWLDLQGRSALSRAALLGAAVLAALLVLVGLVSIIPRSPSRASRRPVGPEARIAEPPDAYLDLDRTLGPER